jgi:3-deoxy-D-manno-octulosonic acid kinase
VRVEPRRIVLSDGAQPAADLFDPNAYGDRATAVQAGGRQAAWFVDGPFGQGVLRHYRRGGMVARISRDRYAWLGEARTRAFREFKLLQSMVEQGLPVPAPVAAAYWRSGLLYRAAILVERLPGVKPLALLLDQPVWQAAASSIARMHKAGVWHADLNAFNILLDGQGQAWIIDFDRGHRGGTSPAAREKNMRRLRRSLVKVAGQPGAAFYDRLYQSYRSYLAATPD